MPCSCERSACVNMLQQKPGVAVVLYPGGAAEALVTEQGKYNVVSIAYCSTELQQALLACRMCWFLYLLFFLFLVGQCVSARPTAAMLCGL